jgi:hypothetical protein
VIEIHVFKPVIGAQPHDVALVADDVIERELRYKPAIAE